MLNVLKDKTLRLQKDDVNIAVYAREALMVARRAVKDLSANWRCRNLQS